MKEYLVIITPDAEQDLYELNNYITNTLCAPIAARNMIHNIRSHILKLTFSPKRYHLLNDEPWHSRGVRRMNVKNFAVFFLVDDEYHEVYIQNIIYQGRDIGSILS